LAGQSFADGGEIESATRVATKQLNHRARPWGCGVARRDRRGIGDALLCTVFEERSTSSAWSWFAAWLVAFTADEPADTEVFPPNSRGLRSTEGAPRTLSTASWSKCGCVTRTTSHSTDGKGSLNHGSEGVPKEGEPRGSPAFPKESIKTRTPEGVLHKKAE
jgi:hypothetical protein